MSEIIVVSGQILSGVSTPSYGAIDVLSGGTLTNSTLGGGGNLYVNGGGTVINTTLQGFSVSKIYGDGIGITLSAVSAPSDLTIESGGISSHGLWEGGFGGYAHLYIFGVDSGSTLGNASRLNVERGGTIINELINTAGSENSPSEQRSGGEAFVNSGGLAIGVTVASPGALLGFFEATKLTNQGGTISGATVQSGAYIFEYSGTNINDSIAFGGVGHDGGGVDISPIIAGNVDVFSYGTYSQGNLDGATIVGGTVSIYAGATVTGNVVFSGTSDGVFEVSSTAQFNSATIGGFAPGDKIILTGVSDASGGSVSLNPITDVLSVEESGNIYALHLEGNYTGDIFSLGSTIVNHTAATIITIETAPCFAAGTRILTANGEVAVQDLKVGDTVITSMGEDVPIQWIGKRTLNLSHHPHPERVRPIRFAAYCFNDESPSRDLVLSPDHALFVDGALIPAKALINGYNVRQLDRPTVTYYHVELRDHSIIFAEGAAVETYLESGNRGAFENEAGARTLHPDFAQTLRERTGCAPFIETGDVVDELRMRILQQHYSASIRQRAMPGIRLQSRR